MGCEGENHKEHMCALKAAKNQELIDCLSDKPTVQCGNCGSKANAPNNVCNPEPLEEA